jgi:hypothetical protein
MNGATDYSALAGAQAGRCESQTQVALAQCLPAAHQGAPGSEPHAAHWPVLIRTACQAGLGGLILAAAERNQWHVPPREMQQLRQHARRVRQNNVRLMRSLGQIALALQDVGVRVLLLKGAALNLTLYETPDQRPMSDLDLLVRPDEVAQAMSALERMGFRRGPGLVRGDFFPRFHYEVEYLSDGCHPVRVDLHVRPFRPLRHARTLPDDAFWSRARLLEAGGAPVWVLEPEEELVHLATHSAYHGHSRLLWLYDIRRLIDLNDNQLDWDQVVRTCQDLRLVLPARAALRKVEDLWGSTCPDEIRRALYKAPVKWRDRLCLAQAPHDANHPVRHVAVNLLCTPALRFRLAYLIRVLFPGGEHMGQTYPGRHRGWLFCAHLRRWWRAAVGAVAPSA